MAYQSLDELQPLATCLRCGAVVADEDQHDEFHDELDS